MKKEEIQQAVQLKEMAQVMPEQGLSLITHSIQTKFRQNKDLLKKVSKIGSP
jgi:hypothetical protein